LLHPVHLTVVGKLQLLDNDVHIVRTSLATR